MGLSPKQTRAIGFVETALHVAEDDEPKRKRSRFELCSTIERFDGYRGTVIKELKIFAL